MGERATLQRATAPKSKLNAVSSRAPVRIVRFVMVASCFVGPIFVPVLF